MIDAPIHAPRALPESLKGLAELALDLAWSWNHGADLLWQRLDPDLWESTGNPWLILQTVSRRRLETLALDPDFLELLDACQAARRRQIARSAWYQDADWEPFSLAAYFSMEFGISEALPVYSGGLGVLAGDMLKTASDLGVPMVGVGLLYQRGYFRQGISAEGGQLEYFPYNDPATLPIAPLRDTAGEWVRLRLPLPGRMLALRAWQARVGRVKLYLLDSNDPTNSPRDRGITDELYGGARENRLTQEIILGIGGWQLLEALGLGARITLCHLNEGHAAFAALAHAAAFASRHGTDFETALTAVRAGTLFTTHTPVDAAFDRFPRTLMAEYLAPYARGFGVSLERVLALGQESKNDQEGTFNMAWLALRTSGGVNGVSRLHARVSRHLFAPLFEHIPTADVPVEAVTNGVHTPTWDSIEADRLWAQTCGEDRWRGDMAGTSDHIVTLSDESIWRLRAENRLRLVKNLSLRIAQSRRQRGEASGQADRSRRFLDPDALTIGFARRFTAYKRPLLLLQDPERLIHLISRHDRPIQIIIAGKAHPHDDAGRQMIRAWMNFLRRPEVRGQVVFVEDYDMAIAMQLVQGVDVWLNTPRRPWEASGTSGMKVLVNGGLNLSELDGWWAEAYAEDLGWALGDGREHADFAASDRREAEALYEILEKQVIPEFYERDGQGIPRRWVARIRASMTKLTPQYSSNRMLREYIERYYQPMSERFVRRAADGAAGARSANEWLAHLESHWPKLRIETPRFGTTDGEITVEVHAYLDDLDPQDLAVELYAESAVRGEVPERITLTRRELLVGSASGYRYEARLAAGRPLEEYTLRVRPNHPGVLWPLECSRVLWQR
ncbi:MAG: alpha-glucan family phosphorylase [Gammaproteobacteria bacterium]